MDIVVDTKRTPQLGETILGEAVHYFLGGKGANQAVACARWGEDIHEVYFFGSIGQDAFGKSAKEQLEREPLRVQLSECSKIQTGIAAIQHIQTDNSIIVVPGANRTVTITPAIQSLMQEGDLLLLQLEIPMKTVGELLRYAKEKGLTTIVNPAPYDAKIVEYLQWIDYITPNETEFSRMVGSHHEIQNIMPPMVDFYEKYKTAVVVTQGEKGVSWCTQEGVQHLNAKTIDAVDTTGAGDTFNGVFASELASETYLNAAIRKAMTAASYSVTKLGAQSGMPRKKDIKNWM